MRGVSSFSRIHLYVGAVDFRKSIDGLSGIVESSMKLDPFSAELFVFVSRCRTRLRILYWDRTGFALWMKRLEKERFSWPRKVEEAYSMNLTHAQLELLLEGVNIFQIKAHSTLTFACMS
ncbi:MAG TPA: IS66 family insertion sequence element accessory protein TnpB [Bdellovibrionota bacterium]|nr:IS66 family insertion sequence element accessory protein TnpB [Bdellovibrionota bacterium]